MPLATQSTGLPAPAVARQLVVAADVTPFKSTPQQAQVTFERTAPDPRALPPIVVPQVSSNDQGFPRPGTQQYELVIPAAEVGSGPGATVPLAYPSDWKATFNLPYQALPSPGTLTGVVTFRVGPPEGCVAFDSGDDGWQFNGLYKYLDREAFNQQPRPTNRTSSVTSRQVSDHNWPIVLPGTGALAFTVELNTLCHQEPDKCVGPSDSWYGNFSGPIRLSGTPAPTGLEIRLQGSPSLVQMGFSDSNGAIFWGPAATHQELGDGWRSYRGSFAPQPGVSMRGGAVRIQGNAVSVNSTMILDYVCPIAATP